MALIVLSSATSLTSGQKAEVKKVEESLLAPCCYSQSIRQHMSGEAEQMRQEVAEMVAKGMNEHEIREHYKALYGERILIVPDGRTGQVLFALPVVAFLVCSGALLLFLLKALKGKTDFCPDPAVSELRPTSDAVRAEIERETGEGF